MLKGGEYQVTIARSGNPRVWLGASDTAHNYQLASGRATMHTPVDVTRDAVAHARQINADCVIAIGGGSTIGLGKAITLNTALPQIAVPTTYAGSEATPILGQTDNGIKTTLTDAKVRPAAVLYDAEPGVTRRAEPPIPY